MRIRQPAGGYKLTCSKCGDFLEPERIAKHRYCLKCHAEYGRENRRKHRELHPEARKRTNARAYLREYIRRGKVEKKPCVVCGTTDNLEAHHTDYDKPLEVVWYCRKHHLEHHENNPE